MNKKMIKNVCPKSSKSPGLAIKNIIDLVFELVLIAKASKMNFLTFLEGFTKSNQSHMNKIEQPHKLMGENLHCTTKVTILL